MSEDKPFTFEAYTQMRRQQIAKAVRQLCVVYGWSGDQLADFLHWSPAHLAEVEQGKNGYRLEELEILAVRFGIPTERLTGLASAEVILLHRALTTHSTGQALAKCVEIPLPADTLDQIFCHPIFSPDGTWVVCSLPADDQGQLLAWDTQTGDLVWRYDHPTPITGAPAFSPDAQWLAFATMQDTVIILRASDRTLVAILDPVEQRLVDQEWWVFVNELDAGYGLIAALCFSPDSQRLAAVNEETGTLRVWNTGSWQHEQTLYVAQLEEQAFRQRRQQDAAVTWKYGDIAISDMRFTLDGQAIALWSRTSDHIEYLPLHGHSMETQPLAEAPHCYEEVPVLSRWWPTRAVLHLVGGAQQALELWQTDQSSSSVIHRETHPEGSIDALRVVDHQTILAIIEPGQRPCPLTLKNLVNNQVVVVAEEAQVPFATFSLDGTLLAYAAPTGPQARLALFVQHLDLGVLRDRRSLADFPWYEVDPASGDLLRESLLVGGNPAAQAADPQTISSSFTAWHDLAEEAAQSRRFRFYLPLIPGQSLRDKLDNLAEFGLSGNAQHDGVYVAFYEESRRPVLPVLAQDFEQQAGIPTRLVDLAALQADADALSTRDLAEAIVDRTLLRGEATPEVFQEIRDTHGTHILLVDSAERLSTDSLVWLVSEARDLARMIFLIIRDENQFEDRVDQYTEPGWLEGRLAFVRLNELRDDASTE